MESLASLDIAAAGYGIRYINGMFRQRIDDGWQIELPETWLAHGNPWEFERRESAYTIGFDVDNDASPDLTFDLPTLDGGVLANVFAVNDGEGNVFLNAQLPTGDTARGDIDFADYASWLDGLVLHGGADMWPGSYGETPLQEAWKGDRYRDVYEIALMRDAGRLRGIPGVIVQGRHDCCTPPAAAWALKKAWPEVDLQIVPDGGHLFTEPGITDGLIRASDRFAGKQG